MLGRQPRRLLPRGRRPRLPRELLSVGDLRRDLRGRRVRVPGGRDRLGQLLSGFPQRGGQLLGPVQGAARGLDRLGDRRTAGLAVLPCGASPGRVFARQAFSGLCTGRPGPSACSQ